ncbi:hypothetical protein [Ralstonia phage RSP15]|uniref:hypothetical protein n=1 Tax=Ralstonia phage RSP15 TaxID=1785960 RepID=UPI00074D3993|nr:hypothetical protein BH754_gp011 [Ralstonia phage RSP15]BAU39969.1 hypothetical protein [Ralstonia phage RSP15]
MSKNIDPEGGWAGSLFDDWYLPGKDKNIDEKLDAILQKLNEMSPDEPLFTYTFPKSYRSQEMPGYVTIGRCSKCNGPVAVPQIWGGVVPPIPTCTCCGAMKKRDRYDTWTTTLPEIEME